TDTAWVALWRRSAFCSLSLGLMSLSLGVFRFKALISATLSGPRMRMALKMVLSARLKVRVGDSLSIFPGHDVSQTQRPQRRTTRHFVQRQPRFGWLGNVVPPRRTNRLL